jgi:hypothetical protein
MTSLRRITEDLLLTAVLVRKGDPDLWDDDGTLDYFRVVEILVAHAEAVAEVAGIEPGECWVPTDLADMTDLYAGKD